LKHFAETEKVQCPCEELGRSSSTPP